MISVGLNSFAARSAPPAGRAGASAASTAAAGTGTSFKGPVGLQLYSLRKQLAENLPATLDMIRGFGVHSVELAGTCGLPPAQFKAQLDARGLVAVSGHFPFDDFRTNPDAIARDAGMLGLRSAGCAWIPHGDTVPFDEHACRGAISVFVRAGEVLSKHGLSFFYHIHGYEFARFGHGTLLDLLMAGTDPRDVGFQMDVFWAVHAGQDPVALLETHGKRWRSMHLKGMKTGTPTGLLTGSSDAANDAAIGTGRIDYAPILQAAARMGVKWYFIEDESPAAVVQIPQSLRYLQSVQF